MKWKIFSNFVAFSEHPNFKWEKKNTFWYPPALFIFLFCFVRRQEKKIIRGGSNNKNKSNFRLEIFCHLKFCQYRKFPSDPWHVKIITFGIIRAKNASVLGKSLFFSFFLPWQWPKASASQQSGHYNRSKNWYSEG